MLVLSLLALAPRPAFAQDSEHWGVQVSFVPGWELTNALKEQLFEENEDGTLKGREFSFGLVHGRSRGGDWGISFVRKPFDDASGVRTVTQECATPSQCWTEIEDSRFRGVYLNAFELHWAPVIATIKNRAQIGINIAGGLGAMKGEIVKTTEGFDVTGFNSQTQRAVLTPFREVETLLVADELTKYFPLIKVEAVGSVILTDAVKIKAAYGVNFPAYSGRVSLVYLFGA